MTPHPPLTADELAELCSRLHGFPASLRARPQWLLWRMEKHEAEKKPRKVPYYAQRDARDRLPRRNLPKGEHQGSDHDRAHLVTFDRAIEVLREARDGCHGLGFAFLPGDGLIGIDIDGAIGEGGEISERALKIVAACASYTELSPSRTGFHIIVEGDTKSFKDNRIGLEVFCGRQYFTCTGLAWSGSPAEVAPISDGTLKRLQVTVAHSKAEARGARAASSPGAATPVPAPQGDLVTWLEQALASLDSGRVSYDEWIGVGMALKSALGDGGESLWDYWSSKGGERYCGRDKIASHWRSFPGDDADGALTVFKMARRGNAWRPPKAWFKVYGSPDHPARERAASGREEEPAGEANEAAALAEPASGGGAPPPAPPSDPAHAQGDAGDRPEPPPQDDGPSDKSWMKQLIRTAEGGKRDCRENVYLHMVYHPALRGLVAYDEFAHLVVKLRKPPWDSPAGEWTTNDDYMLGFWLAQQARLTIKAEATLIAGVAMAAFHARFNPLHDYLHGLPEWDGIERLPFWLHECLGAEDSDYTRLVGTWFIMGMVKRAMVPGCQMDYMVVLEGVQGKRKSTALRTLVGRDDWFADTPIRIGDKDAMLSLAGKWLYEVGELDSFNKAEVTAVKQYVSSRVDRVREPFARRPTDRKRSGVFGGTTNQSEYFKDPTGARRFWPVACESDISLERIAEWRNQLFAEAKHRLASSDPDMARYYPTLEETNRLLVPQQEKREIVDPWFERLATWLDSRATYGETGLEIRQVDNFTAYELLTKCLNVPQDRIDGGRQMATRVGIAMHRMGWEKRRDSAGPRIWRYWRPEKKGNGTGNAGNAVTPGTGDDGQPEDDELHEF